jgi:hypothetical protein
MTGLQREPALVIPVSIVQRPPLKVTPPVVEVRRMGGQKESVGEFTVAVRPGFEGTPLAASVSPAPFAVTVEPDGPRGYKGKVTWSPGADPGMVTPRAGNIVLQIGAENLTVAVRVVGGGTARARPPATAPGPASAP